MKKVVKIILEEGEHQSNAGGVFEDLIGIILSNQQYKITQNIHVTGLEIDLFAEHKIKNEILYAECKAKMKPKSDEIKKFIFNMDYGIEDKKANYGYFIHTEELDRQAAGLQLRFEKEKDNVTFIGPDKIIEILEALGVVSKFTSAKLFDKLVSKLTLLVTPKGYYYVPILQEGSIGYHFTIFDKHLKGITKESEVEYVRKKYNEINDLNYIIPESEEVVSLSVETLQKDTITEVKQSENWYDYTPASVDHFIGRLNLKRELRVFLDKVRTRSTDKRIFFLDGKSGWGKSSLLAELDGYSKSSKYWKSRIYTLAVDTRSANTANFIGLAFKKLVEKAIKDNFLPNDLFIKTLDITSPHDVLSSQSIKPLLTSLRKNKVVLVLIFDQFEDQFRNEPLFEAFYQFCLDVDSIRENIVVGFSWKTEINIPLGSLAYIKFNQLRDYSFGITIPEFSKNDTKQVILQLEDTIEQKVGIELERKLIESSQGFPWLIKKLCIHTLDQIKKGKSIEEILEEELNYLELFESDLIRLDAENKKALDFVAQRAFDGNPFEITESDKISQEILDNLIHKRLIIRTGSVYNIYWDIFRDYLVTKKIPVIGESYLLRQSGNTCLEVFLSFEKKKKFTIQDLIDKYPSKISEPSLFNVLIELRSLGLVRKIKGIDSFELTNKVEEVTEGFFSKYISQKFEVYTPIIKLKELNSSEISFEMVVEVLKSTFKTELFEDKTWLTYARNLVIWIKLSKIPLANRFAEVRRGRGSSSIQDTENQLFYYSPSSLTKAYFKFLGGEEIHSRKHRDLVLLDLIDEDDFAIDITGFSLHEYMALRSSNFNKIEIAYKYYLSNKQIKTKDLIENLPDLFEEFNTLTSKKQIGSVLLSWLSFRYAIENGLEFKPSKGRNSKGNYHYLSFSPKHALNTIIDLDRNRLEYSPNNKKKIIDLIDLGIVDEDDWQLTTKGLSILNSRNPEKKLSLIALSSKSIQEFKKAVTNFDKSPVNKQMVLNFNSEFFKGMGEGSIKTRTSVYKNWIQLIIEEGNS